MDMLMVDMGPDGEAKVGDEVILIGQQGDQEILLDELADKLNTINYEILVGFNDRVRRVLVN
jgi:alanine racemase